jgi:ABC transporter substrate binding protein
MWPRSVKVSRNSVTSKDKTSLLSWGRFVQVPQCVQLAILAARERSSDIAPLRITVQPRNLVELNPDVILAVGARVVPILMELIRSIPIITPSGMDAIARGYVESLARPGGNATGFATMEVSVIGKMLQTLKEIAPNVAHVSMIFNPDNPRGGLFVRSFDRRATRRRALATAERVRPERRYSHNIGVNRVDLA